MKIIDRLTFRTELGVSIDKNEDCPTCSICWDCNISSRNCNYINNALEKLAKYEDLEKQGLLLKLPCKVGDTVYYISDGFVESCTIEVIFLADYMDKDGNYSYIAEIHYDREDYPYVSTEIYFTDIGKTVFTTYIEAEEKLKELSNEGN